MFQLEHRCYPTNVQTSKPQSALRQPLTGLLGTAGNVRVLRELALHGGDLGTATLAQRSGLTIQQVRRVLGSLREQGVVDVIGSGHARLFKLRPLHPLGPVLAALFTAEADAFRTLWLNLLKRVKKMEAQTHGVWLHGSVARLEDQPGSDVDLVAVSNEPRKAADTLRVGLASLERDRGLTISIVGLDLADVARLAAGHDPWWSTLVRDAKVLAGASPRTLIEQALAAEPA